MNPLLSNESNEDIARLHADVEAAKRGVVKAFFDRAFMEAEKWRVDVQFSNGRGRSRLLPKNISFHASE